jgi:Spy/CpxP family protein refolding chaperone
MKSIKFLMLIVAITSATSSYSQKGNKIDVDRVKSHKIAFITDQLNLTAKEAEVFWPIYNAHEKLMSQYRRDEINAMKMVVKNPEIPYLSKKNFDNISEDEAKKIYRIVTNLRNKTHQEKQNYMSKLTTILTYKKILKLQASEREFRKELFRKLKQTRKRP